MSNPVQDLLDKEGVRYQTSAKDFVTNCLSPEHIDSTPSFRIDQLTGIAHCFSCGYKCNIFKHFGVVSNFTSIKVAKLKQKLKDLSASQNGVEFPSECIPYTKTFRGISVKTLRYFGAFYANGGDEKLQDRIFFPITNVANKVQVFVGRHVLSQGNPRYLNYPAGITMPIFPDNFEVPSTTAVLVEGMFDMLNLYDKGITNVCCTFGTNTITKDANAKLLSLRIQGVQKIFILYDGDEAGNKAADNLKPILEECGYIVEKITLPDGVDPGDLDQDYVNSIKEYINA